MNEYFDWWYVTIMLVLYIPLFVGAVMFFNYFFCANTEGHRKNLTLALWLAIISLVLTTIWMCIYICCFYKYEKVYTGSHPWNEDQYIKQSKKNYVVIGIVTSCVIIILYLYFVFFVMAMNQAYAEWYGEETTEEDEEEKEPMMEEAKMEDMMAAAE